MKKNDTVCKHTHTHTRAPILLYLTALQKDYTKQHTSQGTSGLTFIYINFTLTNFHVTYFFITTYHLLKLNLFQKISDNLQSPIQQHYYMYNS